MQTWILIFFLILLISTLTLLPRLFAANCPLRTYGNNPDHVLKYFSSPFCVSCWYQKAELEKLATTHGNSFLIEEYDADWCASAAAPRRIMGTPSFIINETVLYGFQTHAQLLEAIA